MSKRAGSLTRFLRKLRWFFLVYILPRHDATIMTKNGLLSFDSRDRTLGRSLHLEREFEFDGMLKTVELLQQEKYIPPDLIDAAMLDVGGYIGMISIGFVSNRVFGHAVAFEPNPNNYRLLQKNIAQNNLSDRIMAYNVALSDRKETLTMELSVKNYGDHRIREESKEQTGDHYGEGDRKLINVDSVLLDEIMSGSESSIAPRVRLVWMDIQGHEGKFLRGAKAFFKSHRHAPVAMEFWPYGIRRSGMSKEEFCGVLKELFKKFYILDESTPVARDIHNIDAWFDRYQAPDSGCHLILVNDTL
ncbi:MAG: FkbM family methyltransferase [Gammaproteobacteria bacterium]|nr:FkbM family methyltransferase [Gammaproteobacteria bacterium]MDH5651849.1 FkbM family methyltransferase [Gammaproteobacteria bacterium]